MISWHNHPKWSHRGYLYLPELDEDCEGVRKATHRCVSRVDPTDVMIDQSFTPYRWMTESEFQKFVEKMGKVRR